MRTQDRVHPLADLRVSQRVVPLDTDIDRFGSAVPIQRRFTVSLVGASGVERVNEAFAPAQFRDMSDDEKLTAPAFEFLPAGLRFAPRMFTVGADTIEDLARQTDLPADELVRTVHRFNEFAAKGLDPDFGRGQSAYNDCLGDPGYRPNAAVGPLERAPFYATRVLPADVGTCGGVITNEYAQVLDEKDQVIEGLYATGNTTATVMGRTYPGAGASIASSMVFGYVAARHAAGRKPAGEKSR